MAVKKIMASACIHEQDLGKVIKYLHPNIVSHKKAAITFFHLIMDVDIGIETELEKRYRITEENSVLFQSILFVGDLFKKYLGNPFRFYPTRYRKNYYKDIKNLFIGQILSYE